MVANLYQASNSNLDLSQKFNKIKQKYAIPDMKKYDDNIKELSDMDEKKFEMFMEDLKRLKNCTGIFPEQYCDYLIKLKIDPNSNLNKNLEKYFSVFKRAFEDKSQHILKKDGIKNYIVQVSSDLNKGIRGLAGFRYIQYDEQQIRNLGESNIHAINTMFHECRHALQSKHINSGKTLSANEYKMLKEIFIEQADKEYYKRNYFFMYNEIDARIAGAKGAYKYLKDLGLQDRKIIDADGTDFFEYYLEHQKISREDYDLAENKRINEEKYEDVNITFNKILKKDLNILKSAPIFSLEFDENGKRKSGFTILRTFEEKLQEARQSKPKAKEENLSILASILKSKSPILNSIVVQDSNELLKYHTEDKVIKRYRDFIIENELLKTIQTKGKNGVLYIQENEPKESAIEHFNQLASNLYEFAKQNPEEPISEKILKEIQPYIQKESDVLVSEIEDLKQIDKEISPQERKEGLYAISIMMKEQDNTKTRNLQDKEIDN